MPLFKTYTLKFKFDRHLERMVSYRGMQSGLPMFLDGEFGTFKIFLQNGGLVKPVFHISLPTNIKNRSYLDRI